MFDRLIRLSRSMPEMYALIRNLRHALEQIQPRLIWVNCEKSLFCARRAVGDRFPTIIFIRGQHRGPNILCYRDWKKLDRILANNSKSIKLFEKYRWARNRLTVAHNGVEYDELQEVGRPVRPLPGEKSELRVIMPATLIPLKAHAVAIRGFERMRESVSNAVLWICGDTPNGLPLDYEEGLRRLCEDLGVRDRVHFLGWRSDVPSIMKVANVFLLTSETEGLPRSLLEAMAMGLPAVCTSVGGIPEVIVDGENGILIDVGNSEGVASALIRLRDPLLRNRLGEAARLRVKSRFTIHHQAEMFLQTLESIERARG